jgi:hypothetical protein
MNQNFVELAVSDHSAGDPPVSGSPAECAGTKPVKQPYKTPLQNLINPTSRFPHKISIFVAS